MAEERKAAIRAADVPARTVTIYPPPYAAAMAGRAKRALGDLFGGGASWFSGLFGGGMASGGFVRGGRVMDVVRDPRLNHRPEVVAGVLAEDCARSLREFFAAHRG
jgi:hypothetical protein